ncbi:MAG: L-2-amino-thiazoline-4-carboxylic acid hydrolase [Nitrospinae bacterium]|nr:L-2-amino-thiazoline-4-carboxylic acid hydrolase [Nitrospinota bacterium]
MSAFLGSIHYMMFNKIKIAADRNRFVISAFKAKHGAAVDEAAKSALPNGPVGFGDQKLDEILGDNPIHQFLQGLIDTVEVAEGALVTAFLYRFPDDAEQLLEKAFFDHGLETAKKFVNGVANNSPLSAFQNIVGANYLEGMPCDQVSSYRSSNKNAVEVTHSDCLHKAKWDEAGAPAHIMCKLLDKWVEGCAKGVDPNLTLTRSGAIINGEDTCRCSVALPSN